MHDKQVRRRRAILVLLVTASLILLTAYFGESTNSPLHSVQRGVAEVLSPVEAGASKVLSPVRDIAGWFSGMIHAKSQVSRLASENQSLRSLVARYEYEATQNRELTKLVGLDSHSGIDAFGPLAANVIEYNPSLWYQQIEVDKGSDDGVHQYAPVVGDGALVGDVTFVGPSYAVVTELFGANFAVGAEDAATGDAGVLEPAVGNPTSLLLGELPAQTTDIKSGDMVVTSGFVDSQDARIRSIYPPGIPIGVVSNANVNNLLNDQQVTVSPYADLHHLSVVQILTRPYASLARASVGAP